jgi:hypothetical protein
LLLGTLHEDCQEATDKRGAHIFYQNIFLILQIVLTGMFREGWKSRESLLLGKDDVKAAANKMFLPPANFAPYGTKP